MRDQIRTSAGFVARELERGFDIFMLALNRIRSGIAASGAAAPVQDVAREIGGQKFRHSMPARTGSDALVNDYNCGSRAAEFGITDTRAVFRVERPGDRVCHEA